MLFPQGSTWGLLGPEVSSRRSMSDRRGNIFYVGLMSWQVWGSTSPCVCTQLSAGAEEINLQKCLYNKVLVNSLKNCFQTSCVWLTPPSHWVNQWAGVPQVSWFSPSLVKWFWVKYYTLWLSVPKEPTLINMRDTHNVAYVTTWV